MTNKGAVARSIQMDAQAKQRALETRVAELEGQIAEKDARIAELEHWLADAQKEGLHAAERIIAPESAK
jgi:BMFP domain-containing protein YqiC